MSISVLFCRDVAHLSVSIHSLFMVFCLCLRMSNNNIIVSNEACPDVNIMNPVITFEDAFGHFRKFLH